MKIKLLPEVALKLEVCGAQTRGLEFSGFGWVYSDGENIIVYDIEVYNVGSEVYTEIDTRTMVELANREDAGDMRLWFHRHPVGNGTPGPHNWSAMDHNTIRTIPLGGIPELVKWSCAIVRTPYGWVGRIDNHITKKTEHVDVEPNVNKVFYNKIDELKWQRIRALDNLKIERSESGYGRRLFQGDEFIWPEDNEEEIIFFDDPEYVDDITYGPTQLHLPLDTERPECQELWDELSDLPVDNNDRIEEPFLQFEIGTRREDIWHWFEFTFDVSIMDLQRFKGA